MVLKPFSMQNQIGLLNGSFLCKKVVPYANLQTFRLPEDMA